MSTLRFSYAHKRRWDFDDYIDAIVEYFTARRRAVDSSKSAIDRFASHPASRPVNATHIAKEIGKSRANDLMLQALDWLCESRVIEIVPTGKYVCGNEVMGYMQLPVDHAQIALFESEVG